MANNEEADTDIANDVLPEPAPEDTRLARLDTLQPWHKPRKQFVRKKQWVHYSDRLIRHLLNTYALQEGPDGLPEIRYLTLPGTDYIDVRMLSECCAKHNCSLSILGFLAGQADSTKRRAHFREESLKEASHITDRSHTTWYRLEDVSSGQGPAYQELRRRGPFHVVNIDACGSPAPPGEDHGYRIVDAIYKIVELQLSQISSRWLLFITTDARSETVRKKTLEAMCSAIHENAAGSTEFRTDAISLLKDGAESLDDAIQDAREDVGEQFLRLFSLGLAKWLLHLAHGKNWGMKMHQSYYYSTAEHPGTRPTMPCLAFEFVPPPPTLLDKFRVTKSDPAPGGTSEDFSMRTLNKVRTLANLDERMASDGKVRESLLDETRQLLKEAGYTPAALASLETLDDPSE